MHPANRSSRRGLYHPRSSTSPLSPFYSILILALVLLLVPARASAATSVPLKSTDVVAFIGAADVAAAQHTGHLETLLSLAAPGARFRNFGWEGDTVFAQPRDYGFPPFTEHLRKAEATLILVQFGRAEALAPDADPEAFARALEKLVGDLRTVTPRIVLVTPPPFENPGGLLPNLARHNPTLEKFANQIRKTGQGMNLPVVDLFSALGKNSEPLTSDGLQLTPRGHATVAQAFARELALEAPAAAIDESGAFQDPRLEKIRQLVIQKNRHWFNYWRPQNWAFLGGDRTEQPSSRDHRNPQTRWFPAEIEKFQPLITRLETQIQQTLKTH